MNNNTTSTPVWLQILFTIGGAILIGYLLAKLFEHLFENEPKGKTPRIFISHSWKNEKDYWSLVSKFQNNNFDFYNHSIPVENAIDEISKYKIEEGIRNKIKGCSKVLVLGGEYANSYWIKKEVEIANEFNKEVIAIRPWGASKIPTYLQTSANRILGFNSKSIIEKIKG